MKTNVDGEKKMTASPFKFHLLQQKNTHNIYTNTHIYTSIFLIFISSQRSFFSSIWLIPIDEGPETFLLMFC